MSRLQGHPIKFPRQSRKISRNTCPLLESFYFSLLRMQFRSSTITLSLYVCVHGYILHATIHIVTSFRRRIYNVLYMYNMEKEKKRSLEGLVSQMDDLYKQKTLRGKSILPLSAVDAAQVFQNITSIISMS